MVSVQRKWPINYNVLSIKQSNTSCHAVDFYLNQKMVKLSATVRYALGFYCFTDWHLLSSTAQKTKQIYPTWKDHQGSTNYISPWLLISQNLDNLFVCLIRESSPHPQTLLELQLYPPIEFPALDLTDRAFACLWLLVTHSSSNSASPKSILVVLLQVPAVNQPNTSHSKLLNFTFHTQPEYLASLSFSITTWIQEFGKF